MYYSDYNNNYLPEQPGESVGYQVREPAAPKKKKHLGVKLAALSLCFALLGGVGGGAIMYAVLGQGGTPGTPQDGGSTTVFRGDSVPAIVNVANVNQKDPLTPEQIYATYVGSTVGITTEVDTNVFGMKVQSAAAGSGFVISPNGYIVTNYHVIDGANKITVSFLDGKSYEAELVGGDEENDIAVLKIDASGLTPVVIGQSDNLVVGEPVYAIGNPLGELTFSFTGGYVSALDRNVTMSDGRRMNYIQTDTAINSGNSGGALFNKYGQVVGIVSAKLSSSGSSTSASVEGLGFAIPIDDVWSMITDIMEYGYITGRPYLGIIGQSVSSEAVRYGATPGAYILGVVEGSAADKAGLQEGDIITGIDDTEIKSMDDLQNAQPNYKAGESATFTVVRDGEKLKLDVTYGERTAEMEAAGAALQKELNEELQRQYQQQQQQQYGSLFPWGW